MFLLNPEIRYILNSLHLREFAHNRPSLVYLTGNVFPTPPLNIESSDIHLLSEYLSYTVHLNERNTQNQNYSIYIHIKTETILLKKRNLKLLFKKASSQEETV